MQTEVYTQAFQKFLHFSGPEHLYGITTGPLDSNGFRARHALYFYPQNIIGALILNLKF